MYPINPAGLVAAERKLLANYDRVSGKRSNPRMRLRGYLTPTLSTPSPGKGLDFQDPHKPLTSEGQ